ncbi:MAG: hypothetical protein SF069_12045 [Phycisphaerae bacterium]|nr:hypothetical protein [Phycisphaerae bacterium]
MKHHGNRLNRDHISIRLVIACCLAAMTASGENPASDAARPQASQPAVKIDIAPEVALPAHLVDSSIEFSGDWFTPVFMIGTRLVITRGANEGHRVEFTSWSCTENAHHYADVSVASGVAVLTPPLRSAIGGDYSRLHAVRIDGVEMLVPQSSVIRLTELLKSRNGQSAQWIAENAGLLVRTSTTVSPPLVATVQATRPAAPPPEKPGSMLLIEPTPPTAFADAMDKYISENCRATPFAETAPPMSLRLLTADIVGQWSISRGLDGSTMRVTRATDGGYEVAFSTRGCIGGWKLNRKAVYADGVLELDRCVREYFPVESKTYYVVRVDGLEGLVAASAVPKLLKGLDIQGNSLADSFEVRMYLMRRTGK